MRLIGFEVDTGTRRDPDLIADDLKEAGRIVRDGIGVRIAGVRVNCRQRGDRRARRGVLVDRATGQSNVCRVFVDQVVDRDRDNFRVGVARGIGRLDRDVVGLIGFEVDVRTRRDANLVADDFEEARGIVGDRVSVAVACIGIYGVESVATVVPAAAFSSTVPPVSVISVGFSSIRSLTVIVTTSE